MTLSSFLSLDNWIFWRGFLLATCLWLCVLNFSLWYWRRKINDLGALVKQVTGPHTPAESDGANIFCKAWAQHIEATEGAKKAAYTYFLEARDDMKLSEDYAFAAAVSVAFHKRDDLEKGRAA